MSSVSIELPDGSIKSFPEKISGLELAKSISTSLAKVSVGLQLNDSSDVVDIRTLLSNGDKVKIITLKDSESLEVIRHSCAHLMAQALQELKPDVKVTIGPVIEDGFFYDFDSPEPFTPEDLLALEKKMKQLLKKNEEVTKEVWSSEKAIKVFSEMGEKFKVEIIKDLGEKEVSIYTQGGQWFDLCRGPHVQKMGQIKAFKVLSTSGAFWRGDDKNPQLQRIYATAFNSSDELNEHLKNIEEAKKRDHRLLGKQLKLYMFHESSPGAPFFTSRGTVIYNSLVNYMRELYKVYEYEEVITPQVFDVEMYKTSGHYDNYADNMYFSQLDENRRVAVKPMNCPGHCLMFGSELHSYRDLPKRIADFGRLHRYEKSGALHGLTRVRSMAQDDAHIFCRPSQMKAEIASFMEMLNEVYSKLGLSDYKVLLATRPEKRMGSEETWDKSEQALADALKELKVPFEYSPGEGAFYGPKVEVHFVDAIKRSWQLGTIQVDFNMPKNFKLKFIDEDNSEQTPIMLHRAILGSLERFIGIYIEHTAGHMPLWMSPDQIIIMNVSDSQKDYCKSLHKELDALGFRVRLDLRNEKLGYKIREAQLLKTPYMLTIGDKEKDLKKLSVRKKTGETINEISIDDFVYSIKKEINQKSITSLLNK